MQSLQITLTGKIQNTGLLFYVKQFAILNGIKGTVRYLGKTGVLIEAEGEEANLNKFIGFCRTGPQGSGINEVNIAQTRVKHYKSFEIADQENNI